MVRGAMLDADKGQSWKPKHSIAKKVCRCLHNVSLRGNVFDPIAAGPRESVQPILRLVLLHHRGKSNLVGRETHQHRQQAALKEVDHAVFWLDPLNRLNDYERFLLRGLAVPGHEDRDRRDGCECWDSFRDMACSLRRASVTPFDVCRLNRRNRCQHTHAGLLANHPYSETPSNVLMRLGADSLQYSEYALKSLSVRADFDSPMRRFESSRPSQAVRAFGH